MNGRRGRHRSAVRRAPPTPTAAALRQLHRRNTWQQCAVWVAISAEKILKISRTHHEPVAARVVVAHTEAGVAEGEKSTFSLDQCTRACPPHSIDQWKYSSATHQHMFIPKITPPPPAAAIARQLASQTHTKRSLRLCLRHRRVTKVNAGRPFGRRSVGTEWPTERREKTVRLPTTPPPPPVLAPKWRRRRPTSWRFVAVVFFFVLFAVVMSLLRFYSA